MEIIGIVVSSLDGFITKHEQEGVGFASEADQQFFRAVLKRFDCCILGSKTFLTSQNEILDNLSEDRLRIIHTRTPEKYADFHRTGMLEFSKLPPENIVAELRLRGKKRCAVLGGAEVYTQFLARQLLDELWVTLEPRIFGGGKKLVTAPCDIALKLMECLALDDKTLLVKYTLHRG